MRALRTADAVLGAVVRLGAYLGALVILALMFATTADVVRRATSGKSIAGITEGSEVVLAIAVFLGLAYAQRAQVHVSTSVVVDRVPPAVAAIMRTVALVVACAFFAWVVDANVGKALDSVESGEYRFGLLKVPVWPARIAIAIGLALLTLELLRRALIEAAGAIRLLRRDGGPPPPGGEPSEPGSAAR